jgi:translation elongation factor EF-G
MQPDKYRTEVTIGKLYLFMGRSLLPLDEAPAGNPVVLYITLAIPRLQMFWLGLFSSRSNFDG